MPQSPTQIELLSWLDSLSTQELATLDASMQAPLWIPLSGPQLEAYKSPADELLYGGAAGGGKTDLMLGLAYNEHRRAIVFRSVYPSLRGMIDRSREIFNPTRDNAASYNESYHIWRFGTHNDGHSLQFASMQYDKDVLEFQGQPHDFIGFDELHEFSEYRYRYPQAWNRSTIPTQRCRVLSASNPPTTKSGRWLTKHWGPWLDRTHPHRAMPGELRYFSFVDGKEVEVTKEWRSKEGKPARSRSFMPARIHDNPFLLRTGYIATLESLPEPMRSQMLYGNWEITEIDSPWQVIPSAWYDAAVARWQALSTEQHLAAKAVAPTIGFDVARGGDDRTVLARRYGTYYAPLECHPGATTPDGARTAALIVPPFDAVNVDVIGVGSSVYDHLKAHYANAKPLNGAAGTEAKDRSGQLRFFNQRAQWYWQFRESLDPAHGSLVCLPPDDELRAEMLTPQFEVPPRGIKVESKDDIKARLGRSPDKADAIIYASAQAWTSYAGWLKHYEDSAANAAASTQARANILGAT